MLVEDNCFMANRYRISNSPGGDEFRCPHLQCIVCRPREKVDGSLTQLIGDQGDILPRTPDRIHRWMPDLGRNGVVGADAIFSCLGPALEIFSRYSCVEKPNGDRVTLSEYMEHVWTTISKEALSVVFSDADASGFEEDGRLTAIWLWTLSTDPQQGGSEMKSDAEVREDDKPIKGKIGNFSMDYDTARKVAQGLGAHLDKLGSIVEVKGGNRAPFYR